jgi:hypothetical protein
MIGTIRKSDWSAVSADVDIIFSLPGVRAAWPLVSNRANLDFRAYIDAVIDRVPVEQRPAPPAPEARLASVAPLG